MNRDDAIEMLTAVKGRHAEEHSGGCRCLSIGDACTCTLCLLDNVRRYIIDLDHKQKTGKQRIAETLEKKMAGSNGRRAKAIVEGMVEL